MYKYLVRIEFPEINFICFVNKDYIVLHVEPYDSEFIMRDIRNIYNKYSDYATFSKQLIINSQSDNKILNKMSKKNPSLNNLIKEFELTL